MITFGRAMLRWPAGEERAGVDNRLDAQGIGCGPHQDADGRLGVNCGRPYVNNE
jgi:hypothetical protein